MAYKVGDTVNYKTLDMEYYYRGYGICHETGTSNIKSIGYKLKNGIKIAPKDILKQKGNEVVYHLLDTESYMRGYGINYDVGASTIEETFYILENGYEINQKEIVPNGV